MGKKQAELNLLRANPKSKASTDSVEISESIVLDYDKTGNLTATDIDNTSQKLDLKEIILSKLPVETKKILV